MTHGEPRAEKLSVADPAVFRFITFFRDISREKVAWEHVRAV